jgi:serine/threonine-protein kinase
MSGLSVPGFEVLETLRQSSRTVTVKALQRSLDRTVALTFLRPELAAKPEEIRHFLGIARVVSQIKAQGLPQTYDIVSDGDRHYVVAEHVDGPSVAGLVAQKGPLPPGQSVRVAFTVAETLDTAWQQSRLIHRNLKPSEIRIDARGTPKLTDFGRAALVAPDGHVQDIEEPGLIVGTPNFLSPEQALGKPDIDFRADMYALGATLYYLVTGRLPFPEEAPEAVVRAQIQDQIPHPRAFKPDLPATVCGLIARLMMKLPEDRYAAWGEALGDMQHVLKNLPLRRRQAPPNGISTVAPPAADAPPPDAPRLRRAPPAAAPADDGQASAAPRRRSRFAPPSFVQFLLWIALGAWLALLANERLGNRLGLPAAWQPLQALRTAANAWQRAFGGRPSPPTTPPVPVVAADAEPPTRPPPRRAPPPPLPEPAPAPAPVPSPPAAGETPEPAAALPADTIKRLAVAFAAGDLQAARALVAGGTPADARRFAELRAAVNAVPDPLRLAEQTLLQSQGQEIAIAYMGRERRIIPRRVQDGEIQADFVAADGNRPVTFKTARFSSEELVRLMPAEPDTPAAQAAVCIALLKAGRLDEVARRRAACGILAPVFEAAAQP